MIMYLNVTPAKQHSNMRRLKSTSQNKNAKVPSLLVSSNVAVIKSSKARKYTISILSTRAAKPH